MNNDKLPKESLYNIGVKAVIRNSDDKMLVLHITRPNGIDFYWDLPAVGLPMAKLPNRHY